MDRFEELREMVIREADFIAEMTDGEVRTAIDAVLLREENRLPLKERLRLSERLFHSLRGLDLLEDLLEDESITEIMVNGSQRIFVERGGVLEAWPGAFSSPERLMDVIQKIVAGVNRVVNLASPIVDARLPGGERVNAVLPPVAIDGPVLTIRKFPSEPLTMRKMIGMGSVTQEAAEFLSRCVSNRMNLFISGGTGSGKTTFLNALTEYIPEGERIITIEDSAELQISRLENLVRLEVRSAVDGSAKEVSIRDLIRTALRMRPDRIIVGEVRGGECLDMLQAMNTGHEGSLSTGHANSPGDMLLRLETMVLMAADLPLAAVRSQIASAIDLLIHLERRRDGSRGVAAIEEVTGIEKGEICRKPLFLTKEGALTRTEHPLPQGRTRL